ncbi:MAG TPA: hypothetical protein ACFYD6_07325 [Candidatus Brocadiia bacterium]|nr:hypothetical protein [Candidatus Brocadiales bacterium]
MQKQSIINNHKKFENNIEEILQYGAEIILDLSSKGRIPEKEKGLLLESLILRVCALWEKFLEEELILAVKLDCSMLKEKMNLPKRINLDNSVIRAILFSDNYRDFHELDKVNGLFKKYTVEQYNPFVKKISSKQKDSIQFVYKIRNYLSHYSGFAKRVLSKEYERKYKLNRFQEPGKFLIANNGKRFKELISDFKYVSIIMRQIFKGNKDVGYIQI